MKHLLNALILALLFCATPAFAADKHVVKIGVTIPLTGDTSHIGESVRKAMVMAKEDLSADTKYDYELVFEDDMLEAKKAAMTSNKLINVEKSDVVISFGSTTGGVVAPIAQSNKIIHVSVGTSSQSVADGEYNFIHWTPPKEEARVMVQELQNREIKNIAVIGYNNSFGIAVSDGIKKALTGTDITIVSEQTANPGEKDFRTIISKAKATNPDIYILLFYSPELEILAKQIHEAGIETPMTSIEGFGLSSTPSLFEGMWYVDAAAVEKGFSEKFEKHYGSLPQSGSPNAYDTFEIIVEGYENAQASAGEKPSKEDVINVLSQIKDHNSVLGSVTVDEKGVFISPASVKAIKDGKPVLLEETE